MSDNEPEEILSGSENANNDDVLSMLQTISAQLQGLTNRVDAIEMSSRAASKAAKSGSLEGIEEVESAKEGFLRARQGLKSARRKVKLEGNNSGPSGAKGSLDAKLMSPGVAPRIGVNVKTILQIIGTTKSSSKKLEQADYIDSLSVAFETTMLEQIVSGEDRVWEVFVENEANREEVFVQERVMLSVLQSTLHNGTPAKTKFRLAKRNDKRDVRSMYVAVRDSDQLSSVNLTKRKYRRQIRALIFDRGGNYDEFVDKMEEIFEQFECLEDEITGDNLALPESEKVDTIMDKLIESDPAWQDVLDSALTAYEQGLNEFTLEDLHARVHQRLDVADAAGQPEETGKVLAQKGDKPSDKPGAFSSNKPCFKFLQGKCTRGDTCSFSHDTKHQNKGNDKDFPAFLKHLYSNFHKCNEAYSAAK